jgi:S1-C subfamily serine protease
MKLGNLSYLIFLAFVSLSFTSAQTNTDRADASIQLKPGIVVEKIAAHSEAEKAEVQVGDVLLSWVRADAKGQLESPFDLSNLSFGRH